jgi:hypothetical protein
MDQHSTAGAEWANSQTHKASYHDKGQGAGPTSHPLGTPRSLGHDCNFSETTDPKFLGPSTSVTSQECLEPITCN